MNGALPGMTTPLRMTRLSGLLAFGEFAEGRRQVGGDLRVFQVKAVRHFFAILQQLIQEPQVVTRTA